jgi:hypothetical protein
MTNLHSSCGQQLDNSLCIKPASSGNPRRMVYFFGLPMCRRGVVFRPHIVSLSAEVLPDLRTVSTKVW